MTPAEFDNGYWYAVQLKRFAKSLGVPMASALRKDQLEELIKRFLAAGRIDAPGPRTPARGGVRDVERGLTLQLPIAKYTNDKATKDFLEREARKIAPGLGRRSGARYRLNRWREQQLARGIPITYRDLVVEYVRLSRTEGPFKHIPHGRYINFVSDYFAAEQGATRAEVLRAWKTLKRLNIPKTYQSLVQSRRRER